MQSERDVRQIIAELGNATWAYAAVTAAVESGLLTALTEPRDVSALSDLSGIPDALVAQLLAVLIALDLVIADADQYVATPGLLPLLGQPAFAAMIRAFSLQAADMVARARSHTLSVGWTHTDPAIIESMGVASGGTIIAIAQSVFPQMAGLSERLATPGAVFLDVGAGIGAISVAMCRLFPALHVVALEPAPVPMDAARRSVAASGVGERIALRPQRVEELDDNAVFDLAWLPHPFFPGEAFTAALHAIHAALRPGGWLLIPYRNASTDARLDNALAALLTVLYGGEVRSPERLTAQLVSSGFGAVQTIQSPGGTVVVGQRAT